MKFIASILLLIKPSYSFRSISGDIIQNDFPIVRLNFKNGSHVCTGTYINNYTILTAGTCVSNQ
ncbi:MAG: trypsin-like serine protease [Bdellovibrionales bacterium]